MHSPAGTTNVSSLPEISEQINSIAVRLSMQYKLDGIAIELKGLLDKIAWMLRIQTIASSELVDRREEALTDKAQQEFVAATPTLKTFSEFPVKVAELSPELGVQAMQLMTMLASVDAPNTPEDIAFGDRIPYGVDYSSEHAQLNSWHQIRHDHSVLLALVHGYRFLLEAGDQELHEHYPSRLALISKIRGLEVKAAANGTQI